MWRNLHKGMITAMNNNEVTADSKMEPADSTSKPVTVEKLDIKSMRDYLPMYLDAILSGAREPAISTGFAGLDIALGGGLYPGLYIMGAISSLGKTTLADSRSNRRSGTAGADFFAGNGSQRNFCQEHQPPVCDLQDDRRVGGYAHRTGFVERIHHISRHPCIDQIPF